jgi:methylmalonyl-CoA/ethylmalonyl-CoA epimerase
MADGRPRTAGSLRLMLPLNLHHTAIAVRDLDRALSDLKRQYGVEPLSREVVEEQGVEEAMVPLGGSYLQVLMPLSEDTPVGRFIARRGEGMHHIAIQVADIDAALAHLRNEGVPLVDDAPRPGGSGSRIAFVHPRAAASTLVELVEVQ